jgi:hypothetical protein
MTFDFFMTLDRSDIKLANKFNIFDNVSDLESFCVEDEISALHTCISCVAWSIGQAASFIIRRVWRGVLVKPPA